MLKEQIDAADDADLQERHQEWYTDGACFIIILDVLKSKELEEELKETKSKYEELNKNYRIKLYIDFVSTQIDTVNESNEYINRYFRIEKKNYWQS